MSANPFPTPDALILTDQGPFLQDGGVMYRTWAYGHKSVVAHIENAGGSKREIALEPTGSEGYFAALDPKGAVGDLYRFSIDGAEPVPDFATQYQPHGVLGPSMVVNAGA